MLLQQAAAREASLRAELHATGEKHATEAFRLRECWGGMRLADWHYG